MKIISGTANKPFSIKIAEYLDNQLCQVDIGTFKDGEKSIVIQENVRKQDCFIIQPTGPSENGSPNDNFMEILILVIITLMVMLFLHTRFFLDTVMV